MKINISRVLVLILLILNFSSCQYEESEKVVLLKKKDNVILSKIFSEILVIPLETKPESLIHNIKKIEYHQSHYYILDDRSQQILCFDKQGRFIFKIASQGKGQGEYNFVTDFTVDTANNTLILLDPVFQRVLFFDIHGSYLKTYTLSSEVVMGYNEVFTLEDSILLLTSITNEQLIYYCLKEERIIQKLFEFDATSTLEAFMPKNNVFQFSDRTFALPALQREIYDVTEMTPVPHYQWCFGKYNNSQQQINRLLTEIKARPPRTPGFIIPYQAVGAGKILSHHIVGVYENNRFMIAWLEFENNYTYVIADKKSDDYMVFNQFQEGTVFPFENLHTDRAISYFQEPSAPGKIYDIKRIFPEFPEDYLERNRSVFNLAMLSDSYTSIIENHDPMNDNPFLVVFVFKE